MSPEWITIACPYCGEHFETAIDTSGGDSQHYIEDCAICCQPITLLITVAATGEIASIRARRDDDGG